MQVYRRLLAGAPASDAVPDRRWREALSARGLGRRPGPVDALAFRLLHTPAIYRAYLSLGRGRAA